MPLDRDMISAMPMMPMLPAKAVKTVRAFFVIRLFSDRLKAVQKRIEVFFRLLADAAAAVNAAESAAQQIHADMHALEERLAALQTQEASPGLL